MFTECARSTASTRSWKPPPTLPPGPRPSPTSPTAKSSECSSVSIQSFMCIWQLSLLYMFVYTCTCTLYMFAIHLQYCMFNSGKEFFAVSIRNLVITYAHLGLMLSNLSPSPNLYCIQSVCNNNIK